MWFAVSNVFGQEQGSPAFDPAGYVNKYDRNFKGVGPEVYVLPAPRTKQEIIRDSYAGKGFFRDTITSALDLQTLLSEFRKTSNIGLLANFDKSSLAKNEDWVDLINKEKNRGNLLAANRLMNEYVYQFLQQENISQAIGLLNSALAEAEEANNEEDINAIRQNLADIYLFSRNFREAAQQQEELLRFATRKKAVAKQADAHVKLAMIQANLGDYSLAENTVIRKAFPIYNRTKDHEGKINALQYLATIYKMQQRYTEVQWFLLQAQELAKKHKFPGELAEIEFMLASSKISQENYRVALKELETAKEHAKNNNNDLLELAIVDKLGDLHLILANYDEAASELESYWRLRNRLFSNI